ncbi:MAG: LytTR family DNA-binding domain-containing protein [Bacteroidia bacterium]
MERIRAILVDDEKSARDVLENLLLRFCPEVEVLAKCPDLAQAVEAIGQLNPDVVFLDIRMPQHAGFEIAKLIDEITFEIVFVTAHDEYAIRAFELAAVDYLLKPIDISRLREAVARVKVQRDRKARAEQLEVLSSNLATQSVKNILIHEKGYQHVVTLQNILAIEAMESYCIVHALDRKYMVSKNLKHFETLLATVPEFFRVHKSWLVNLQHLQQYNKAEMSVLLHTGLTAKLSKYKVVAFEEAILRN